MQHTHSISEHRLLRFVTEGGQEGQRTETSGENRDVPDSRSAAQNFYLMLGRMFGLRFEGGQNQERQKIHKTMEHLEQRTIEQDEQGQETLKKLYEDARRFVQDADPNPAPPPDAPPAREAPDNDPGMQRLWKDYAVLRSATQMDQSMAESLRDATEDAQLKAWRSVEAGLQVQWDFLRVHIRTMNDPSRSGSIRAEAGVVEKQHNDIAARIRDLERTIADRQRKAGVEEVDAEYKRVYDRIQERATAFGNNARITRNQMNAMNWRERGVARLSGVWAGMEKTAAQDQEFSDRLTAMLTRLVRANRTTDLPGRMKAIDDIRGEFGLDRPSYREANAALARGSDQLRPMDVTTRVRERPTLQPGQEMYIVESETAFDKGWIVQSLEGNKVTLTKNGRTETRTVDQVWHASEIESGRAMEPNVPRHPLALLRNRMFTMLERYGTLSRPEYVRLFATFLRQANYVGNCFLISSFEAIRNSPDAEYILRTSVRVVGDGFAVKIPLGNADGRTYSVSRQEMQAANGRNGVRLDPVGGGEGWQALEVAYMKASTWTGSGERHRFSGGGHGDDAMRVLFGNAVNGERTQTGNIISNPVLVQPFSRNQASRAAAEQWLNAYVPGRNLAVVGTPRNSGAERTFTRHGTEFWYRHAYTLLSVDPSARQVTVVNPHDTSVHIRLTYDQFMDIFSAIESANVDYSRMFRT